MKNINTVLYGVNLVLGAMLGFMVVGLIEFHAYCGSHALDLAYGGKELLAIPLFVAIEGFLISRKPNWSRKILLINMFLLVSLFTLNKFYIAPEKVRCDAEMNLTLPKLSN